MKDIVLLSKISQGLNECCKRGKIKRINRMAVIVNKDSKVNLENLSEYLKNFNEDLIDDYTEIKIETEDLPEEAAIIRNIEGELIKEEA